MSVAFQNSSSFPSGATVAKHRFHFYCLVSMFLCLYGVFFFRKLLFDILHPIFITCILHVYFLICFVSILLNVLAVRNIKISSKFCLLFNVIDRVRIICVQWCLTLGHHKNVIRCMFFKACSVLLVKCSTFYILFCMFGIHLLMRNGIVDWVKLFARLYKYNFTALLAMYGS